MKRRGRILYILALLVFCLSSSCTKKNQNITGNTSQDTIAASSDSSNIHLRDGSDTLSVDKDSLDAMIRTRDSIVSERQPDSIRIVHEKKHQQEPSGEKKKSNNQNDKKPNDKGVKPPTRPSGKDTKPSSQKTDTHRHNTAPLGRGEEGGDESGDAYNPGPPQATPPIKFPLPHKPRPKGR